METILELIDGYQMKASQKDNLVFQRQLPELKQRIIALWKIHVD